MQVKPIVAIVGLVAVALPLAVFAGQPAMRGTPSLQTAQVLSMLMLDPYETTQLSVKLPQGFATLDVDGDPFGAAR